jgi:hypothetical protein
MMHGTMNVKLAVLWAGALSCNKTKSREQNAAGRTSRMHSRRRSITPLQNSAFTVFPSVTNSLCTTPWESEKWSTCYWCGTFRIPVTSAAEGNVSPTHSELCRFVSGSQAKHQVSSPIIILLKKKKKMSLSAIAIVFWQDVTPSSLCSGVKTCTQLSLSQILFQNARNYSLGDVQRFCYHSWCDSTVIFD